MRKSKRLLSLFITLVMLMGFTSNYAIAASKTSGKCGKNAKWSYNTKTKTLTISGKGPMYDYLEDDYGFPPWDKYTDSIKTIKIKKGITHIGKDAFHGTMWASGSSISIPNTVKSIGTEALGVTGVKSITIPGSVKTIKERTFMFSEAKKIKLKYGVKFIDDYAFDRTSLTSITFPSSVIKIGRGIFNFSGIIKTVTFTGNAPKINSKAFSSISDDPEAEAEPIRLTIYYPKGNKTWKSVIKKQYGGKVKWVAK